jgi:hypothetical protein
MDKVMIAWPMTVNDLYVLTGYLEDQVEGMDREQKIVLNLQPGVEGRTFVSIDKQESGS